MLPAIATLVSLNACYVWRPAVLDAGHEFLNGNARLTRTDGTAVVVRGPRLVGDSIVGTATRTVTPVAFARADVRRIEVRRLSRGRTAAVGAVLMAAYLVATWGFSDSSIDTAP
jgi:hypothetical protein